MQIDPHAAQVVMTTQDGSDLTLSPGKEVVARVIDSAQGSARISLAGQIINVQTPLALQPGSEIKLSVTQINNNEIKLTITSNNPAPTPANTGTIPQSIQNELNSSSTYSRDGLTASKNSVLNELSRAGVKLDPSVASAISKVASQITENSSGMNIRALAQLASRDLPLSTSAASRVVNALELAGSIGNALESLASKSNAIATALPSSPPSAAALRGMLTPALEPTELAVARIINSGQTTSSSSTSTTQASTPQALTTSQPLPSLGAPATLSQQATRAAIVGVSASPTNTPSSNATVTTDTTLLIKQAGTTQPLQTALSNSFTNNTSLPVTRAFDSIPAQNQLTAAASSSAATGVSTTVQAPTQPPVAQAIADLATLTARVVSSSAPAIGNIADSTLDAARGSNATEVAQRTANAGVAHNASNAGVSASGNPAPLVTAIKQFLASEGLPSDTTRLAQTFNSSSTSTISIALQRMPEQDALRVAEAMLTLNSSIKGHKGDDAIRQALHNLGLAFQKQAEVDHNELAQLRTALHHLANSDDPSIQRSGMANDAARILSSIDGGQIISRPQNGIDAGYLYLQVPLPDGRGAEVLVRRDPARRTVTFEEFDIAFLLNTEHLGTLMIHLDAQPSGIRADVKTDIPAMTSYLESRSDDLLDVLATESRRPVTINIGSFEHEPPANLLAPQLGLIEPGTTEFYV